MARRTTDPQPGIAARGESDCQRCGDTIHVNDRIVYKRGWAIHVRCANGGDDR